MESVPEAMIAVDTNVLVRFIVADHPEQFERAVTLFRDSEIFIGLTIFLEAEWVLRSAYSATRPEIASAFMGIAGLANVSVESPAILVETISAYRNGMDFADALHLLCAREANVASFATFDQELQKRSSVVSRPIRILGL